MSQDFIHWLSENDARTMSRFETMKYYFPYLRQIPDASVRIKAQYLLQQGDFKDLLKIFDNYGINVVSSKPTGQSYKPTNVAPTPTSHNFGVNPFGEH